MLGHIGYFNTSGSRTHVGFQFSTHAAAGGNVAPGSAFEAADLRIYRAADGAAFSATQRSSASGITMTSPFDSLTGVHDVDIDLTDNTDSGFYAAGYRYSVMLAPDTETIDSQTITGVVLAVFEIGPAPANVTQFGGTAGTFSSGRPEVNTSHAAGTAWGSGAITAAAIASDAITAAKIADGAIDAATFATGAITATAIAADAIGASELATDAVQEIRNAITGGAYALDTDANGRLRIVDGTAAGEINTNAGAIALVDLVTDITTKTGYRLSATGVDDIWDEPLAAHTTSDTPGLVLNMLTQDSVTLSSDVALGSIIGQLLDAGTSWTYDRTTDSLEAIRDRGDAAWATGTTPPTAAAIADQVWDEILSGHAVSGSTGEALSAAGGAGDPWITALPGSYTAGQAGYIVGTNLNALITSRMATYTQPTGFLAATFPTTVASTTNITAASGITVSALGSGVITAASIATDAIDADALATDAVNEIRNAITGGAYDLDTDSNGRIRIVDGTGTGEIDTSSGAVIAASLGTQAKADVNAEVVDALNVDTYAEPGQGTPPATASIQLKNSYLYKAWRNKHTQTASQYSLYADDASTVDQKASASDDGTTFTRGEVATGP